MERNLNVEKDMSRKMLFCLSLISICTNVILGSQSCFITEISWALNFEILYFFFSDMSYLCNCSKWMFCADFYEQYSLSLSL